MDPPPPAGSEADLAAARLATLASSPDVQALLALAENRLVGVVASAKPGQAVIEVDQDVSRQIQPQDRIAVDGEIVTVLTVTPPDPAAGAAVSDRGAGFSR